MYDISLVMPSVYPAEWQKIYNDIEGNLGPVDSKHHLDIKWELIIVGPSDLGSTLQPASNWRFIQDYGNPTRCVHIASTVARGKLFTWLSDDCSIIDQNLRLLVEDALRRKNQDYEYVVRYLEFGANGQCGSHDDRYWTAGAHGALDKLKGLSRQRIIAPVGLLNTKYFRQIGGFDCKFMHINMGCIDLSLRVQNLGHDMLVPNISIYKCMQGQNGDFLTHIFENYDKLYFWSIYDDVEKAKNRLNISYDNWVDSSSIWTEKFGTFKV